MTVHSVRELDVHCDDGFLRSFAESIYIATLSELVAIGLFCSLAVLWFVIGDGA